MAMLYKQGKITREQWEHFKVIKPHFKVIKPKRKKKK